MRPAESWSDPGGERVNAPIGTQEWAQRVRLELQSAIKDLNKAPERVAGYIDLIQQHRAWTLLNRRDGARYATFEEFCADEPPYGLGRPFTEIEPHLTALNGGGVKGKRITDLMTVAPAAHPPGKKTDTVSVTSPGDKRRAERNRAILRAPAEVQDLYREGAISQTVAAKLGPKKPTPEAAHRIVDVVQALRDVPRERKAVDAKVRELLGEKRADLVEQARRLYQRMNEKDRARFLEIIGVG